MANGSFSGGKTKSSGPSRGWEKVRRTQVLPSGYGAHQESWDFMWEQPAAWAHLDQTAELGHITTPDTPQTQPQVRRGSVAEDRELSEKF